MNNTNAQRAVGKEHPTYRGYLITEDGEVYSCIKKDYRVKGRGSKTFIDYTNPIKLTTRVHPKNGYVYVTLGGKNGSKRLHRLVAETYIENPNNLKEVNHLDQDKTNNKVSNLEWCSRQRNAEYSLSKTYLIENIKTGERFEVFNLASFCRVNNLHCSTLRGTFNPKKGRSKQHKGYKVLSVN